MAKYKVLKNFLDYKTRKGIKKDDTIELTDERAKELQKNLEIHGGGFLEKLAASKPKKKATKKEGE